MSVRVTIDSATDILCRKHWKYIYFLRTSARDLYIYKYKYEAFYIIYHKQKQKSSSWWSTWTWTLHHLYFNDAGANQVRWYRIYERIRMTCETRAKFMTTTTKTKTGNKCFYHIKYIRCDFCLNTAVDWFKDHQRTNQWERKTGFWSANDH